MPRPPLRYFFTNYGDIYPGFDFSFNNDFPNHTIIIPAGNLRIYNELPSSERTREKIKELGWLVNNKAIIDVSEGDFEKNIKIDPFGKSWNSKIDRRLMFIFGAGASAHCVFGNDKKKLQEDPLRPPLGNELFAERLEESYSRFPGVTRALHLLQGDEIDVESILEDEWMDISDYNNLEVMKRHLQIQYYLQLLLNQISYHVIDNYSSRNLFARFADKLQKFQNRKGNIQYSFVTFNQDTILEKFLENYFGWQLKTIDDYIEVNAAPYCLYKVHGSSDWGWRYPDAILEQYRQMVPLNLYNNNVTFYQLYFQLLGDQTQMVDWKESFGIESEIDPHRKGKLTINKSKIKLIKGPKDQYQQFHPAILLPYRDKDEFTLPPSHYQALTQALYYAERLIIIGWKGNEDAFKRIMKYKATSLKRVVIVDPNVDIVKTNLHHITSNPRIDIGHYPTFEEFVMRGLEEELKSL